ncbi:MAG: hypothetical protein ACP59X_21035 [Solidesulfovibrio sp. DCME]|uniref:hypothetical protein n=1 Tax=Solidesulfovibrio sp. DCME TaxID=3447380 RepID=UPI003D138361
MKIVIATDGLVKATHGDAQYISGVPGYAGCLVLTVPDGSAVEIGQAWSVSLTDAVAARVAEAAAACDAVLTPLAARFPIWETKTWDKQLAEAKALLADPTLADAPNPDSDDPEKRVDHIPTIRGITAVTREDVGQFAISVLANDETWTAIVSNVAGQRQVFVARLNDCTTVADVLAVPLAISLPDVGQP